MLSVRFRLLLQDLLVNEKAQVLSIDLMEEKVARRLREIGICEGQIITCLKKTPFGGPGIYQTGDSVFSIERTLADFVKIKR